MAGLLAATGAHATDTYWQGTPGTPLSWMTPGNWTAGLPNGNYGNAAWLTNGGIVTITPADGAG